MARHPSPGSPILVEKETWDVFLVEVFSNQRWAAMSKDAFVDSRHPQLHEATVSRTPSSRENRRAGNFDTIGLNCDLSQHPSRVYGRGGSWGRAQHGPPRYNDVVAFTDRDVAIAYARRLRRHGRWAHAWEGREAWRLATRKERLQVRVTHEVCARAKEEIARWA